MSNYDPTDIRAQELQKQEELARRRIVRDQEIKDVKWLMSSEKGRRIVWRLLGLSGTFQLSFDQNAMKMAFNEGKRNLGNKLYDEILTLCPEMFPVMWREQQEQQNENRDGSGPKSN